MMAQDSESGATAPTGDITAAGNVGLVDPAGQDLKGEYDSRGLARRVALAFDQDTTLKQIDTLYVSQQDSTVILNGSVDSPEVLDQLISIASSVEGVTGVDTHAVIVQSRNRNA